ncbi:1,2-phenylacetyl-CoA epoxidase subunit PaaC [Bergeyella zoohelcum]|uniref:Phenylacetic acid degradation protein paaC n=1 Tax=Bergeyella zoohelcum TaxID=1015 RepID=A0A7Z9CG87_9FLAO|nr:1,2-phenylacetyl-CoA epoxidase subunit PaaC [Bergeyella zoohelcum]VDH04571.1 Phenylacetic acid degradation protein paaC [Bergeyella zoohelcum]
MKNYILKLADDSLIMGQRLAEWCGKGPYLEEDIALINIALDQLGQANNLYNLAVKHFADGRSIDDFAMKRVEKEYLNAQLVEMPNGDYAQTILKAYFFAIYQLFLYEALSHSEDEDLKAIGVKSLKEVKYHYTHTETWMRIFANGTDESKQRLLEAIDAIWEYTGGLFDEVEGEENLVALNLIPSAKQLHAAWTAKVKEDFAHFGLEYPESVFMQRGSRKGIHTEYFGYILCELQYMQRTYPDCTW